MYICVEGLGAFCFYQNTRIKTCKMNMQEVNKEKCIIFRIRPGFQVVFLNHVGPIL